MPIDLPSPEELREVLSAIKSREGSAAPWCDPDDPKYAICGRAFINQYNEGLEPPAGHKPPSNIRPIRPDVKPKPPQFTFDSKSWGQIQDTDYPPLRWIISPIIPEGLTLFSGPPKIGKSWMALNICIAVASGAIALGKLSAAPGKVLYLALEDSERRLKQRTQAILDVLEDLPEIRDRLHFVTTSARLNNGLIDAIQHFLANHPDTILIIIDTLAKIKPTRRVGNHSAYENDYADLSVLQTICSQKYLGIMLMTHNRKQNAEDVLEDISGSMGLSGSADTIMIMKRVRGSNEASLFVTGRDVEQEQTYGLAFDPHIKSWAITGVGPETGLTEETADVLDILREHGAKNMLEIARLLFGDNVNAKSNDRFYEKTRKRVNTLIDAGLIHKEGKFFFPIN